MISTTVFIPGGNLPAINVTSYNSLICFGQTATLTANGANTYTWNTTATGSIVAVSPTVTTTYTVTGSNVNGCSNTATITQAVSLCTGINNSVLEENEFKIYPNPFSGVVSLTIDNFTEDVAVKMYNSLGQLVYKTKLLQANSILNLKELPAGIYFVDLILNR